MKDLIKIRHVFVMTLLVSIIMGYAGLVNARVSDQKLTKPDAEVQISVVLKN